METVLVDTRTGALSLMKTAFLIFIAVTLTFGMSVKGGFVVDDKLWAARENAGDAFSSPKTLFTSWGFTGTSLRQNGPPLYRPLGHFISNVFHYLVGPNPAAYHLFSLTTHYINSLLVFALIGALLPALPWSSRLAAALAFAVHPALTEAVAWISSINELQMTACVLSAMLCYIHWRKTERGRWLAAALLFSLAGVMIKEGALSFVIILFAYDWLRTKTIPWQAVSLVGSCFLLFLILRFLVIGSNTGGLQISFNLWRVGEFLLAHLRYLFIPGQQPFSMAPPELPLAGKASLYATAVLLLIAAWWASRQSANIKSFFVFTATWIFVALWPAYAIALIESGYFAARHIYLPAVGWALALAGIVAAMPARTLITTLCLLLGVLVMAPFSFQGVKAWRTDSAVYQRATEISPNYEGPWLGLGNALIDAKEMDRAAAIFRMLLAREPKPALRRDCLYSLALISAQTGQTPMSNQYLEELIRFEPGYAPAWVGLGNNAWLAGQFTAAIKHYRHALTLDPQNFEASQNLLTLQNTIRVRLN